MPLKTMIINNQNINELFALVLVDHDYIRDYYLDIES
jgi:hypothetical protein